MIQFIKRIKNVLNRESRLKAAFSAISSDMKDLKVKQDALRMSVDEWIMFLNRENQDLKARVRELEAKIEKRMVVVDNDRRNKLFVLNDLYP